METEKVETESRYSYIFMNQSKVILDEINFINL